MAVLPFSLAKWYFDCSGSDGSLFIGYCAVLRLHGLAVHYASLFEKAPGENGLSPIKTRTSLVPSAPSEGEGAWSWSHPRLKVSAEYQGIHGGFERVLLEDARGSLRWRCALPLARAVIRIGCEGGETGGETGRSGEKTIEGLGYVEHLETTIPPWELPLETLRWGRFAAPDRSVVWIEWSGPAPLRLVLRDGLEDREARIEPVGIVFSREAAADRIEPIVLSPEAAPDRLELGAPEVLRSGTIGSKALASTPAIRRLLPKAILAAEETKWRCPAVLHEGAREIRGEAVHEIVRLGGGVRCPA